MFMRIDERTFSAAAMLAFSILLTACGRKDAQPGVQADHHHSASPVEEAGGNAADAAGMARLTTVEMRHFDIYNTYRVVFDHSARASGAAGDVDEGVQPAVLTLTSAEFGGMPSCMPSTMQD